MYTRVPFPSRRREHLISFSSRAIPLLRFRPSVHLFILFRFFFFFTDRLHLRIIHVVSTAFYFFSPQKRFAHPPPFINRRSAQTYVRRSQRRRDDENRPQVQWHAAERHGHGGPARHAVVHHRKLGSAQGECVVRPSYDSGSRRTIPSAAIPQDEEHALEKRYVRFNVTTGFIVV